MASQIDAILTKNCIKSRDTVVTVCSALVTEMVQNAKDVVPISINRLVKNIVILATVAKLVSLLPRVLPNGFRISRYTIGGFVYRLCEFAM